MVSTALLVAEPWPSHRLAPSLYGLAVQNLRVRLRAHTSSPRPSESEYPPHPRNDVPTLFTPLPSARTITQTSRILKRLRAALPSRPHASNRVAGNIMRTALPQALRQPAKSLSFASAALAAQSPDPGSEEKYFLNFPCSSRSSSASAGASFTEVILAHFSQYSRLS